MVCTLDQMVPRNIYRFDYLEHVLKSKIYCHIGPCDKVCDFINMFFT